MIFLSTSSLIPQNPYGQWFPSNTDFTNGFSKIRKHQAGSRKKAACKSLCEDSLLDRSRRDFRKGLCVWTIRDADHLKPLCFWYPYLPASPSAHAGVCKPGKIRHGTRSHFIRGRLLPGGLGLWWYYPCAFIQAAAQRIEAEPTPYDLSEPLTEFRVLFPVFFIWEEQRPKFGTWKCDNPDFSHFLGFIFKSCKSKHKIKIPPYQKAGREDLYLFTPNLNGWGLLIFWSVHFFEDFSEDKIGHFLVHN